MPRGSLTASQWVQLLQAMVAVELVERRGLPVRRAAKLIGVAPSAISQYVTGARRGRAVESLSDDRGVRAAAREVAQALADLPIGSAAPHRILLEAAARVSEVAGAPRGSTPSTGPLNRGHREAARRLRTRVRVEQAAVSECMHLAQKAGDELTRAIFRQIASDSLRHAEIVASLAGYLDSGVDRTLASGVTERDVRRLIERERQAEREAAVEIRESVDGTMALLVESMEADERKHEELLNGLLERGFGGRPTPVAPDPGRGARPTRSGP